QLPRAMVLVPLIMRLALPLYAFSRFRFKGRQNGLMLFLLLQLPRAMVLVPLIMRLALPLYAFSRFRFKGRQNG
ncbi:hypothetical protein CQA15_29645, partial [Klebsiella pneumoniae]